MEDRDALLELLRSPESPWRPDGSWSRQAQDLRELSVQKHLDRKFLNSIIKTLRIVDQGVAVVDDNILSFSGLEELILSANSISELQGTNLPLALRVLELYANQVSCLEGLSAHPPPRLQHLGLGCNHLGSPENLQYLSASLWPNLVSLDLSWSGFAQLRPLVDALSTLPCLRALALEGNPLTLACTYPGIVVDCLPRLLYLDWNRLTPDDRHRFRGLALHRGLEEAVVQVSIQRIRGLPDPSVHMGGNATEFPLVSYNYVVTSEFLDSLQNQEKTCRDSITSVTGVEDPASINLHQRVSECHLVRMMSPDTPTNATKTKSYSNDALGPLVQRNSTQKLPWGDDMEFNHRSTHRVSQLALLKDFFLHGLWLFVEEEKVLSWPASPAENPGTKTAADKKAAVKEGADPKSKDKKKKKESVLNLVHDAPIRRTLGAALVDLQDLVSGKDTVHVTCDLGVLSTELNDQAEITHDRGQSRKSKEDKKKEDKKAKPDARPGGQRNAKSSKGKGKGHRESETETPPDNNTPTQMEPMTVDLEVQLERWPSTPQVSQ